MPSFALSVLAALGHLSQRERQGTGDADSHASDIGHWLGMTGQKQGAGAADDCRGGRRCPPLRNYKKKSHSEGVVFLFVIALRFCCSHPRISQGRGNVRGETFAGFPTRVQSPARRRALLRSKSAAPKRKHHPDGWCFLFGAGYGSRTRLNGLGSRCNTDIPTLHSLHRAIVAYL